MEKSTVIINGKDLKIGDVVRVASGDAEPILDPQARPAIIKASENVARLAERNTPVYGVNTGVGVFADKRIDWAKSARLSRNQILSQMVGLGPPFTREQVRAAMLIRINSLTKGFSGVRIEVVELMLEMLRRGVTPIVPQQGSLGSSGDLAPLSHIAVVFSCDPDPNLNGDESGQAWFESQRMSGSDAMSSAGLKRIVLDRKEGASLTNGISFSTAILVLNWISAQNILRVSDVTAAMTLEALRGVPSAFNKQVQDVRPHPGICRVAERIRHLTEGSTLLGSSDQVQDAYSLRCTPQIVGPAWDLLDFVEQVINRELNAVSDNPILFNDKTISSGHFHGEPIGLAADYLKIALCEVGAVSERRAFRLLSGHTNQGLPPMLIASREDAGLESGMMMLQYTSASLVHENQALASPNSIHSLPTSAGMEDHNSNATTATINLSKLINNLQKILAIELILATQALDLRLMENSELSLGKGVSVARHVIREKVEFQERDRAMSEDIMMIVKMIKTGELVEHLAQFL